jgi:uncharacterized protein (DUF885 family)
LSASQISTYDVVLTDFQNNAEALSFDFGAGATAPFPVTQVAGAYASVPDFLDSRHAVGSIEDADAYLSRLQAFAAVLNQQSAVIQEDAARGVMPPAFCIDATIRQITTLASVMPAESILVRNFSRKLSDANFTEAQGRHYADSARGIVETQVVPALRRQIDTFQSIRARATDDAGCWRLPHGEELYRSALKYHTTTDLEADAIHRMGLESVQSLNAQMDATLRAEGLTSGSIAERMAALARRPGIAFANTDEGREELLDYVRNVIAGIQARMPEYTGLAPRATVEVRRVPSYMEAGRSGGYYEPAALDGSRPATFYINLRNTADFPRFMLPTLTYHESIPGHHLQLATQLEAKDLPFLRTALLRFTAFQEGWGLYAETLADELGVYEKDPLGRLGYLQSMAFRACRLVVDTGLHAKRWTRERAVQSMSDGVGAPVAWLNTEVDRYCVWPGQACGYMVGRETILRLRESTKARLGTRFDVRRFHDVLLGNGPMPLSVAERSIQSSLG